MTKITWRVDLFIPTTTSSIPPQTTPKDDEKFAQEVKGANRKWSRFQGQGLPPNYGQPPFWDPMRRSGCKSDCCRRSILQTGRINPLKEARTAKTVKALFAELPFSPSTSILHVNDSNLPSTRWQIRERAYEMERCEKVMRDMARTGGVKQAHEDLHQAKRILAQSIPDPDSYQLPVELDPMAFIQFPTGDDVSFGSEPLGNCAAHGVCLDERCPYHQHFYQELTRKGLISRMKHVHWGSLHFKPEVMVHARSADELGANFGEYCAGITGHDHTREDADERAANIKDFGKLKTSALERLETASRRIGLYRGRSCFRPDKNALEPAPKEGLADRSWKPEVEKAIQEEMLREMKEARQLKRSKKKTLRAPVPGPAKKAKKSPLVLILVREAWTLWRLPE